MKKIVISVVPVLLLLSPDAHCQLEKGSFLGSFYSGASYSNRTEKDYDLSSNSFGLTLSDQVGYFIADRLAIGPGLAFEVDYTHNKYGGQANNLETRTTRYSGLFDPFLRYYSRMKGKLAFFGQLSGMIGYGQNIYKSEDDLTGESKDLFNTLEYGGGAGAGMTFFMTGNIGLETMILYQVRGSTVTNGSGGSFNQQTLTNNLALNVGLTFYFQRSSE